MNIATPDKRRIKMVAAAVGFLCELAQLARESLNAYLALGEGFTFAASFQRHSKSCNGDHPFHLGAFVECSEPRSHP